MGGHGFDPGPQHIKIIKNGTSCSSLGIQTYRLELGLVDLCQDTVTGCGIMSSVWGMILQWGSTIKVSIELPVASRHCHDMTEKLLKATINRNKQEEEMEFQWYLPLWHCLKQFIVNWISIRGICLKNFNCVKILGSHHWVRNVRHVMWIQLYLLSIAGLLLY